VVLHAGLSNLFNGMVRRMAILTEFGGLHISLKWKDVLPRGLSSGFCHALACLPWEYGRNRLFDPCREIKNLSDFYR